MASESLKEELIVRLKNTETNVEALKTADQGKKQGKLQTYFKFTCNLYMLSVFSNDLNHYSNLTEQNWRPDLMPATWRARTHEWRNYKRKVKVIKQTSQLLIKDSKAVLRSAPLISLHDS